MAVKLALVVLACMVVAAPCAEAVLTCGQIVSGLAPCLGYLRGTAALPPNCCGGVKSLLAAAKTTPDRRAGCACLKQLATSTPGIKQNMATGLPGKCGVNLGYPVSLSVDCTKVK